MILIRPILILLISQNISAQSLEFFAEFERDFQPLRTLKVIDSQFVFTVHYEMGKDSDVFVSTLSQQQYQAFWAFANDFRFTIQDTSLPYGFSAEIYDGDTVITSYIGNIVIHGFGVSGWYKTPDTTLNFYFYEPNPKSKDTQLGKTLVSLVFQNVDDISLLMDFPFKYGFNYFHKGNDTLQFYGHLDLSVEHLLEMGLFMKMLEEDRDLKVLDFSKLTAIDPREKNLELFFERLNKIERELILSKVPAEVYKMLKSNSEDLKYLKINVIN